MVLLVHLVLLVRFWQDLLLILSVIHFVCHLKGCRFVLTIVYGYSFHHRSGYFENIGINFDSKPTTLLGATYMTSWLLALINDWVLSIILWNILVRVVLLLLLNPLLG